MTLKNLIIAFLGLFHEEHEMQVMRIFYNYFKEKLPF